MRDCVQFSIIDSLVVGLVLICTGCSGSGDNEQSTSQDSGVAQIPLIGRSETERFGADSTRRAEFRIINLQQSFLSFVDENGRLPESIDEVLPIVPPGIQSEESYRFDPWGREHRYELFNGGFELRSAGSDGIFEVWSEEHL
jgi:hypothetical protein